MRAYQDMVFSTAARLVGDDGLAQDFAQEAFVRAYENFSHLRTSPTAGGWLKTVTTNLVLNHLSRYRKRWRSFSELKHDSSSEDSDVPFNMPAPDGILTELDAEERRVLIDAALRRLPDHQRLPLVLHHFDDLAYEEIAVRLRVSLAKVKSDIHRGRSALLRLLATDGVFRSSLDD